MTTSDTKSLFGRRLKDARKVLGLAQDKLGVLIGLDESCVTQEGVFMRTVFMHQRLRLLKSSLKYLTYQQATFIGTMSSLTIT